MALPASGPLSINNINVELGKAGTTQSSLGQTDFRTLAGVASGAISMSNFYGKANWTLKTGNFYVMTANNKPSPFVASTYNNGAYNLQGSPYQSFDNNSGTYYQGSYTNGGQYVGSQITLNKTIKLRKLYIYLENASGFNCVATGFVDVYNNGAWVNVYNSNGMGSGETRNTTLNLNLDSVTHIRARMVYGSGETAGQGRIREIRVTQWYEKG